MGRGHNFLSNFQRQSGKVKRKMGFPTHPRSLPSLNNKCKTAAGMENCILGKHGACLGTGAALGFGKMAGKPGKGKWVAAG